MSKGEKMKKIIGFPDILIDYLEINNISSKDFAKRIDISQKHFSEIINYKKDLTIEIIRRIASITDFSLEYIVRLNEKYHEYKKIDEDLETMGKSVNDILLEFRYKDVIKTKYCEISNELNDRAVLKDILNFLRVVSPKALNDISDSGSLFKAKDGKFGSKLLWLEKCYKETLKQDIKSYNKDNIAYLVKMINDMSSNYIYDEKKMINEFNNKGIFLVFQDDLPGSGIRGAFKVERDKPAIYITRKHRRPADIYFAILHELAHCKSDFNAAKKAAIISDDSKVVESRADTLAFNWMIDDGIYNTINSKYCFKDLEKIVSKYEGNKMFLIYRLAHDHNEIFNTQLYQKYNKPFSKN